jgi:cell division protein FtsW
MKEKKPDYFLGFLVLILILWGLLTLTGVSSALSQKIFAHPYHFLIHQILMGLLPGMVLGFLAFKLPLDFFRKWSFLFLVLVLIALILVFVPGIGLKLGGASRWLNLGFFSFQPAEFLKLAFIFYLASWLSAKVGPAHSLKFFQRFKFWKPLTKKESSQLFLPFLILLILITVLLVFQPDIGTLGILLGVALIIYFLAGTSWWQFLGIGIMSVLGLVLLIFLAPYRLNRLLVFLNPKLDPLGIGYQIQQAQIAIGSGGWTGVGWGMSLQKYGFLPQPLTDSIFAILAQETGFLGSLVFLLLMALLIWRGFKIAKKAPDLFSQLLAYGVTFWLGLQTLVNVGSMVGILPLTGIPLPFLSYGGSALIAELIGIGILLNISKRV